MNIIDYSSSFPVRNHLKTYFKGVFIVLLMIIMAACQPSQETTLRIGTNLWPGYEPLYLAEDLEYWSKKDIRLVEYPSASEVIRAFRNRSLEAAALTLDEAMLLWNENIPVKIVLVLDISNGADAIIGRGITDFQQLKGKKIAVESNALGALFISRALKLNDMKLNDIELVHLNVSSHEQAFKNGTVDAAVTFEPVKSKLLELGGVDVFNSAQIPGEIVDVLVVHEKTLLAHPEHVRMLVENWYRAISHINRNLQQAAIDIAQRHHLTPAQVIDSFNGLNWGDRTRNRQLLGGKAPLLQTANKLADIMLENQLLPKKPDLKNIIATIEP